MKRFLAMALVLGVALSAVALAGDQKMDDKTMSGTISKVDNAQKMMTVKDKAGKEWTIYWNDSTKVEGGAPKEGAMVWFKADTKDGKMWATWVKTGDAATRCNCGSPSEGTQAASPRLSFLRTSPPLPELPPAKRSKSRSGLLPAPDLTELI